MMIKRLLAATLLCGALSTADVFANEHDPKTLQIGSWVCATPEVYDHAVAEQRGGKKQLRDLRKELEERKACLYMDDDNLEDMLAPYVSVIEQQGDKVKVTFFVEFYQRVEMLHRKIRHVRFVGWTSEDNVKALWN